ncbi:MAG: ABC transporter permease [Bradymonadaceae bacterium]|nr:ABC transporter permease [Lujinxingiaceae bacterium]
MTSYIIKRLILMIPTFAVISLIIFVVLNFAPGSPAGATVGGDGMENVSADARESYRIFKEQFGLDKPVMFNTRYALTAEEVTAELAVVGDFYRPVCPAEGEAPPNCITLAERPTSARIIAAQEQIEDWGDYIVPHLFAIASTHERVDVRRQAANRLSQNAQRRLINEYGRTQTPEERAHNQSVSAENNRMRSWTLPASAGAEEVDQLLAEHWGPWFEQHGARFDYSLGNKIGIFFTDTRFARYWANLLRFDFGVSTVDKKPVMATIIKKLGYTITLSFFSLFFAYIISVPLGVWSAYNRGTKTDDGVTLTLFLLYSLPSFFAAVLLLRFFAMGDPVKWFPAGGFVGNNAELMSTLQYMQSVGWHLLLPVICLTYGALASLSRYARTGLLDVIRADYIRTARAKGLSESMVVIKHAVRNGMIPILTLLGALLPSLISGSVVIEFIFNIPGLGLYLFESITMRDYNAIMGCLLMSTVLTLFGMLVSDVSYAVVDPRISFD